MGEEMKQGYDRGRRPYDKGEPRDACCDPCDPCDPCEPQRPPHRGGECCDPCDPCCDSCDPCDPCEPPCDEEGGFEWGSWIPILVIIFLLCGGFSLFGGGKDECCEGGGFGGFGGLGGLFGGGGVNWILILVVIFLIWSSNQDDRRGGGFLGGLF